MLGLLRHGLSGGLVSATERLLEWLRGCADKGWSVEIKSVDSGGRLRFVGRGLRDVFWGFGTGVVDRAGPLLRAR